MCKTVFLLSLSGSENEENSTNAAIRKVISAISGAAQSSSESKVKEVLKKNKPDALPLPSPSTSGGSPRSSGSGTTSKSDKLPNRNTLEDKRQKSNQDAQPQQSSPKSPNSSSSKSNKVISNGRHEEDSSGTDGEDESEPPTNKPRKPFNKLFEGVVFVMSGFENPYRKSLRDRALEMGAKCKPNWDSTCTHLM